MIIDSHCHLDFSDFNIDRKDVLSRAHDIGIEKIIVPGVKQNTWNNIKSCCEQFEELYPCYGLHPYFINEHQLTHLDDLKNYIEKNKAVAIGECGLDFFIKNLEKDKQKFYFEQQLDIALEFDLPVVIHARKSTEAVIKAIKQHPGLHGMIHSYSGSYEQAQQLIDLNFYLSFGGPVTYEKSTRLRKLVESLPLDSILVETDSPDQPVALSTDKRNEPACIISVIQSIAQLHNTSIETISAITSKNAQKCFNLSHCCPVN